MDLLQDISQNKFVMVLLNEQQYFQELVKIVKKVDKEHEKICYVCLSKTVEDVADEINRINLNVEKFYFIDVLSSHYKQPKPRKNCTFLEAPSNLTAIKVAVTKAVNNKGCSVVIFDTISALLVYQEAFRIMKMTHDLMVEKVHEKSNTVFIVLKSQEKVLQDMDKGLIGDLSMIADKTLDLTQKKAKNG